MDPQGNVRLDWSKFGAFTLVKKSGDDKTAGFKGVRHISGVEAEFPSYVNVDATWAVVNNHDDLAATVHPPGCPKHGVLLCSLYKTSGLFCDRTPLSRPSGEQPSVEEGRSMASIVAPPKPPTAGEVKTEEDQEVTESSRKRMRGKSTQSILKTPLLASLKSRRI